MADALTGKTEIDAVAEEVVSARVQEVLTATMVAWPLMSDYSDMVGPGMDALKIPKFGNFTVASKVENVAADAQINAFSADTMNLSLYKVVQFLVEDIAGIQAKPNITAAYVDQAAKDMAADMDREVFLALEAGVSLAAPDHLREYNDTVNNDLEKVDILEARRLLSVQNVPSDERWGIISPDKEKDLLNISEFVRVDESGGSEALRNGRIGKLFGFDMYVSTKIPTTYTGASYFGHKTALAVARQLMPKTEMFRDVPNLGDRWSISHLFGTKGLDSGKRHVIFKNT